MFETTIVPDRAYAIVLRNDLRIARLGIRSLFGRVGEPAQSAG